MVQPILPLYMYEVLNLSEKEIGIIIGSLGFTSLIIRLPASLWVTPQNIAKAIFIGLCLNALSILGYCMSNNVLFIWLFRMLHGASWGMNHVLMLAFPSIMSRNTRTKQANLTSYTIFAALGQCIGPAIAALSILSIKTIYGVFLVATGLAIMSSPLMGLIIKNKVMTSSNACLKIFDIKIIGTFRSILRPAVIFSSSGFILFAILTYGPLKASLELSSQNDLISSYFSILYVAMLVSRIFLLIYADDISKRGSDFILNLEFAALMSCAIGMLLASLSTRVFSYVFGIILIGLGCGLVFPVTASEISSKISDRLIVLGDAIYFIVYDIGSLMGPIFISLMLTALPLRYSMASSIIIPLICVLAWYMMNFIKR